MTFSRPRKMRKRRSCPSFGQQGCEQEYILGKCFVASRIGTDRIPEMLKFDTCGRKELSVSGAMNYKRYIKLMFVFKTPSLLTGHALFIHYFNKNFAPCSRSFCIHIDRVTFRFDRDPKRCYVQCWDWRRDSCLQYYCTIILPKLLIKDFGVDWAWDFRETQKSRFFSMAPGVLLFVHYVVQLRDNHSNRPTGESSSWRESIFCYRIFKIP